MAVRSIYLPRLSLKDDRLHIRGDEHRHLAVTRAVHNEVIEIFEGMGTVWTAAVESVAVGDTIVRVIESRIVQREPVELTVGLALVRMAAFEFALEKSVEVGVVRIVPFRAGRWKVPAGD